MEEIMGETRVLVPGDFYRHFKDKLYQVRMIAYDSETKEKMVVYQAMYGDFQSYVRPFDMFMSEVDHEKYPEVKQKYRFEKVMIGNAPPKSFAEDESVLTEAYNQSNEKLTTSASLRINITAVEDSTYDEYEDDESGEINPILLKFLDAENYQDKLNLLTGLKSKLNDRLINDIATSMDITVEEGDFEKRYESLRNCILAHLKYEGSRLRQ